MKKKLKYNIYIIYENVLNGLSMESEKKAVTSTIQETIKHEVENVYGEEMIINDAWKKRKRINNVNLIFFYGIFQHEN